MSTQNVTVHPGKIKSLRPSSGLPAVSIRIYRREGGKVFEDLIQLSTAHHPQLGESVQGLDGNFHKVVSVNRTYPDLCDPIVEVVCALPPNESDEF
jgi:hypothetical protein